MAFNFQPGTSFRPQPLDFSEIANIPDQFWKGQDQARLNQARQDVSEALKRGDYQAAAAGLAQINPGAALNAYTQTQVPNYAYNSDLGLYVNPKNPNQTVQPPGSGQNNPYATPGLKPDQQKASSFFKNGASADQTISELGDTVNEEGIRSQTARGLSDAPYGIGSVANSFVEVPAAKLDNAAHRFVNAINRRESGATVSPSEIKEANEIYIPQKGDAPEVIAQKAKNRLEKLQSIAGEAGPRFSPEFPQAKEAQPTLEQWAAEAVKQGADPAAVRQRLQQIRAGAGQ